MGDYNKVQTPTWWASPSAKVGAEVGARWAHYRAKSSSLSSKQDNPNGSLFALTPLRSELTTFLGGSRKDAAFMIVVNMQKWPSISHFTSWYILT